MQIYAVLTPIPFNFFWKKMQLVFNTSFLGDSFIRQIIPVQELCCYVYLISYVYSWHIAVC